MTTDYSVFFAPCNFCPWSSTFANSCARSQICPQLWLNRDITRHWDSPSLKFTNWQLRRKGQKYNGGQYLPVYSNIYIDNIQKKIITTSKTLIFFRNLNCVKNIKYMLLIFIIHVYLKITLSFYSVNWPLPLRWHFLFNKKYRSRISKLGELILKRSLDSEFLFYTNFRGIK